MAHRGGCGCEVNTGDGSGLLVTIPDTFYRVKLKQQGITLPPKGEYGTGLIFFSQKQPIRDKCQAIIEKHCAAKGFNVIAWRDVPTDNKSIGPSALASEPKILQLFVAPKSQLEPTVLETELMILRRLFEREIRGIDEVSNRLPLLVLHSRSSTTPPPRRFPPNHPSSRNGRLARAPSPSTTTISTPAP